MNFESNSFEELTSLAGRMLDGDLPDDEITRLSELISEGDEAHEAFVQFCELHSMLAAEPAAQKTLSQYHQPGNVVSLPGTKQIAVGPERHTSSPSSSKAAWLAAAAVIAASIFVIINHEVDEKSPLPELTESPKAEKPERVEFPDSTPAAQFIDEEPEEQYEHAVIASPSTGSQDRPPTTFTSEPSFADLEISFNRDIRPILSDNCFNCHGPDEHSRKADLRLDTREGATGGEYPAIVAGDSDASELIARLLTEDEDDIMPPPESHKKLTPDQILLLTRWVNEGAEWEGHWSFMPNMTAAESLKNDTIDTFIDRELARLKLSRNEEASRRTLVRRVTLDLTGLPPTPDEVDAFLANTRPSAYEDLVDELLSRSTFGEHRARYWLDAARYADTHGLHLDNYREIWPYRDWVINAFNENMPFDQFTIEQIGGDLLPDATVSQQIATGFNRCNVTTSEGGSIDEEYNVRYAVDRVSTTATVWMGLTAACAQCHNHKFDPITMTDFYQLYAFFNNTTQKAMDGNIRDSPPVIRLYDSPEQEKEAAQLQSKITKAAGLTIKLLREESFKNLKVVDVAPHFFSHDGEGAPTNLGKIAGFGKDQPFSVSFRYSLPEREGRVTIAESIEASENNRGWRIYWENRGFIAEIIESDPGKVLKRGFTRRVNQGSSGYFTLTYDGSGTSRGIKLYFAGAKQPNRFELEWFDTLTGDFAAPNAELVIGGSPLDSGASARISEFTVFDRAISEAEVKALSDYNAVKAIEKKQPYIAVEENTEKSKTTPATTGKKVPTRNKDEQLRLDTFLATFAEGPYREAMIHLADLQAQLSRIQSSTPTTLVMAEKPDSAPVANLLIRGEYDQKGHEVEAAFPDFLPDFGGDFTMNRLGLAQWLVHPDHPLTARVTVNRIWQELFGIGLVKTSEDFGTQGESPSHPKLLDWLAASFIKSGWDVKKLYRTILLSETYRQSSRITEKMAKWDPQNRLLARGPRFRLDAEVIRDQALFASGLMDVTIGGPGVKPYQPSGIWKSVGYTNSNTQTFHQDFGPSAEHRRTIYSFWKRTAHAPNLAIFDAPNREACVMRRERTNTPLQALVLMNDPQYVRAARYLALRVISETEGRDARIDRLANLLRSRPLTKAERLIVLNSLDQFQNIYESDATAANQLLVDEVNPDFSIAIAKPEAAPELAAWTMIANQMLNLDEVITKN